MRISKLKSIPMAVILIGISIGALSTSAYAQIGVKDDTANGYLRSIEGHTDAIEKSSSSLLSSSNTEFMATGKHRTLQETHYESQIARLDAMISVLHNKGKLDGNTPANANTLKPDQDIFEDDAVIKLIADRAAITTLRTGAKSGYGSDDGALSLDGYRVAYGLKKVSSIYKDNPRLARGLDKLYDTVYNTEVTVNAVSGSSDKRMTRYDDLSTKARNATDLKTSLDVNNALLLENGRNLALLIDLQTAQLDAQVVQLRKETQTKNAAANAFGESNALGLAALGVISAGVNTVTAIN